MAANEVIMESNAFIMAAGDMASFSFFFLIFGLVEESSKEETERLCLVFLSEATLPGKLP